MSLSSDNFSNANPWVTSLALGLLHNCEITYVYPSASDGACDCSSASDLALNNIGKKKVTSIHLGADN